MPTRNEIITEARSWIDTPYQHRGRTKGESCDCLGLILGIWEEFHLGRSFNIHHYSPDWSDRNEELKPYLIKYLNQKSLIDIREGDVILFSMSLGSLKHMAIATGKDTLIHSYWGRAVVESHISPYWSTRFDSVYEFPGVVND